MKKHFYLFLIMIFFFTLNSYGKTINFDKDKINSSPKGWICGITGRGTPKWLVIKEASAPSKPNVLYQSGEGSFPWCVISSTLIEDGVVEVKFKPIAGKIDEAGGLIWRFKNGGKYYVARANALENNVSLYYVKNGWRRTIRYVNAKVPFNKWSYLKVEFIGNRIKVYLNNKKYIDLTDNHISGRGKVGVWTKADSKTMFDDFFFQKYR